MAYSTALNNWTISEILRQNEQKRALGQTGLSAPQVEAGIQGALEGTYSNAMSSAKALRETDVQKKELALREEALGIQEKGIKSQEKAGMVSTAIQAPLTAGVVYGVGKSAGWWGGKPAVDVAGKAMEIGTGAGVSTGEAVGIGAVGAAGGYTAAQLAGVSALGSEAGAMVSAGITGGTAAAETGLMVFAAANLITAILVGAGILVGGFKLFGDKIVCTELNRQGYLPDDILAMDSLYCKTIDREVHEGYLIMFRPIVNLMQKSKIVTNIIKPFGLAFAYEMASRIDDSIKGNWFGKVILWIGSPVCRAVYHLSVKQEVCHA